ncbi:MAG: GGDEF domain-containing protein [Magnetospirillum sp.]|nr:GGDEF domain-containing protein [Magnetospirillum sp.]
MPHLVGKVMDSHLADLFTLWRAATPEELAQAETAGRFDRHRDHLLVIEEADGHTRYRHYGRSFTLHFGKDLTGQAIDALPSDVLTPGRRGILAFEYAYAHKVGKPLWRSYTAQFDDGMRQTWQRLVLPAGPGRLLVGAYDVEPPRLIDTGSAKGLLRLVIERVPVVLDEAGAVADLALSLQAFGDTQVQVAELEVLASRDPLTNTSNLRHFHHLAGMELEHARRMGRSFALLALDIDHFKRINDSYGHAAGDSALKAFAAACRTALREPDILGRLGGEEFAVALPNTGAEGALVIAERLRRLVEELRPPLSGGDTLSFTVSIGVATCGPDSYPGIPDLLARADEALYAAKKAGRNRVILAEG